MRFAFFGVLLLSGLSHAEGPLMCTTEVPQVPPIIRKEGLSELIGDVILRCTGGTLPPLGSAFPTVNFTFRFNIPVTNAHNPDGVSDALLLVDEPNATPTSRPFNFAPVPPPPVINTGNVDPSAIPNVFQGLVNGNQVVFNGIPVLAPSSTGTRVYRITNLRVNATALSVGSPVLANIFASPPDGIAISNPNTAPFATVAQGLNASVLQSFTQSACTPANSPFTANPNAGQSFTVRFREGFANSFKTFSTAQGTGANRLPAAAKQDTPGQNVTGSELGFRLQQIDSQISSGTQFAVFVNGVPQTVDLWFPVVVGVNSHIVAIDKPGGQRVVVQPTVVNFFKPPISNGSASIYYEMSDQNALVLETFDIQAFVSYPSGGAANNSPAPGTITVNGSFAPLSPINESHVPTGSTSTILPRFADGPTFDNGINFTNPLFDRFGAFTITECGAMQTLGGILPVGSPPGRIGFSASQGEPPPLMQNVIGTSRRDIMTGLSFNPNANNTILVPGTVPEGSERAATSNWLTVDTTSSATPFTGRISVNPAGLAPGRYTGSIAFGSAAAGNVNIPVDLTVTGPLPYFTPAGVTSAGSYVGNLVTPGEAIVIFGTRFGPPVLAGLDFSGGQVGTVIGETRVLFDGVPAPMIYAVNGQVSAFVPYTVAANLRTQIQVEYKGVKSNPVIVPVIKAVPALLTSNSSGSGQAAALNQDNSFNLPATPERVGNQVVLFGSGGGQTTPVGRDGRLNGVGGTLPVFNMGPISVTIGGKPAVVAYSGPAPGAVEGVFQVNVTIPPGTPSGPASVVVFLGDYVTQPGVTISVR